MAATNGEAVVMNGKEQRLESGLKRGELPPITNPYSHAVALDDLPGVVYAMDEFLGNRMKESESYLMEGDPKKERLYFATGLGLIETVKALLSYADDDLLSALSYTKHSTGVAAAHRKKAGSFATRITGYISGSGSGTKWYNGMNTMEQHAELIYAESLFEKALLGIVYSGDWIAFVKEALNMRTCISIYRALYAWLQLRDSTYSSTKAGETDPPPSKVDPAIDVHLRSGIYLGAGLLNVILSLLPARLLSLAQLFGLGGDRKLGLAILMACGGWSADKDKKEPAIRVEQEGVRRPLCDLGMLVFHLVLSTFTFDQVDLDIAEKIVKWNIDRWNEGVFPLLASGRLALLRSQPEKAVGFYLKAISSQEQYRNLWHMCWWELALSYLALWDVEKSVERWRSLAGEATWSKAIYTYGLAVCLLQTTKNEKDKGEKEKKLKEVRELMEKVPGLRQRIAGKSIPLEKFVARKARKYIAQNERLCMPALEFGSVFATVSHAPQKVLEEEILEGEVRASIRELEGKGKEKEKGYWDDYCLCKFLEGVCLRYLAYPDPAAHLEESGYTPKIKKEDAVEGAKRCFAAVLENGKKIELDHQLVYNAHFELGRLLACTGDTAGARREFELVLSGKPLEVSEKGAGRKGKYSLENALHMRTSAAVDALEKEAAGGPGL